MSGCDLAHLVPLQQNTKGKTIDDTDILGKTTDNNNNNGHF